MASQIIHSHRRNLAPSLSQPKTSMDPTVPKKHPTPKSNPIISSSSSSSTTTKPHPTPPDPTVPSSTTTTIKNISHHFAKLYAGHKGRSTSLLSRSHPQVDINLQAKKGLSISTVFDTSCVALTKSNSQQGRRAAADVGKVSTRTKVKEKDKKSLIKKSSSSSSSSSSHLEVDVEKALARQKFNEVKKSAGLPEEYCRKEEVREGKDVKKASIFMSKSLESAELKRCNEVSEMRRQSISLDVNGGRIRRRKSFCCSQIELADFFSCNGVKVVAVDMPPFMQIHAVDCARKAYDSLEKFTSKNLALTLKKEFDGVYGPAWHCIVGTNFGSFVTHSVGGFLYFSMDQKLYILLFKTTVQRAD